jgi:hypothetical protein
VATLGQAQELERQMIRSFFATSWKERQNENSPSADRSVRCQAPPLLASNVWRVASFPRANHRLNRSGLVCTSNTFPRGALIIATPWMFCDCSGSVQRHRRYTPSERLAEPWIREGAMSSSPSRRRRRATPANRERPNGAKEGLSGGR